MSNLKDYITKRSENYPGAIRDWMVEEMTDAVRYAFDDLYGEIYNDQPYGGAKERIYELMDKVLGQKNWENWEE